MAGGGSSLVERFHGNNHCFFFFFLGGGELRVFEFVMAKTAGLGAVSFFVFSNYRSLKGYSLFNVLFCCFAMFWFPFIYEPWLFALYPVCFCWLSPSRSTESNLSASATVLQFYNKMDQNAKLDA